MNIAPLTSRGTLAWVAAIWMTVAGALVACNVDASSKRVALEEAFNGQRFDAPVEVIEEPSRNSFLVAELGGQILRIDPDGDREAAVVLDLGAQLASGHNELGLLSIALDPDYVRNGQLWVYYTAPDPLRSVIARYTVNADGIAQPDSALTILEVEQPHLNHNGGAVRFGPDGMLYVGLGDGGDQLADGWGTFDPYGNGQDTTTLHGAIIRIDVSNATAREPYRVPPDNPFVNDHDVRDEIWAYGFRNPWRMAFDTGTGELWVGDVGQDSVEEVNRVEPGRNYGWSAMEGEVCHIASCPPPNYSPPVFAFNRDFGPDGVCAVTGGTVYRGNDVPELRGHYIFGDLCFGNVWSRAPGGDVTHLFTASHSLVSINQDSEGELYFVAFGAPVARLSLD